MKPKLDSYGFPPSIVERLRPIVQALQSQSTAEFHRVLARLTLDLCVEIEEGTVTPKTADDVFTLLDLYLGDQGMNLDSDVRNLLSEGTSLHHFGDPAGPTLSILREAAARIEIGD